MKFQFGIAIYCVTIIICVLLQGLTVYAATASQVSELISTLQQNYSRQVRPPTNQSNAVTVNIGFFLNSIREFDEASERFSCIGTSVISWTDDRIVWNPVDYGGTFSITVDNDLFWSPSIYVRNSMEDFKRIAESSYWKVRYYLNGFALFYPGDVFTTHCQVDVEKYPWDTQNCSIMFGAIAYVNTEVQLEPRTSTNILQRFTGDGTWEIVNTYYGMTNNFVQVVFTLKRNPRFVILNVILPVVFMYALDLLVFLIPAESGERISFCLTVLLAIAVFLTLVADSMPKSATSIAWFSYYLVSILAVCIFNIFAVILNLRLFFKENETIPRFIESFLTWLHRTLKCHKTCKVTPMQEPPSLITRVTDAGLSTTQDDINKCKSHKKGQETDSKQKGQETDSKQPRDIDETKEKRPKYSMEANVDAKRITWKDVSYFVDALLFVMSLVMFCIITVLYFNTVS